MNLWDKVVPWITAAEGVHDPSDPGDAWYGIDRRFHPHEPWPPSKERALEILKAEYWDRCHCDRLPMPLAVALFDAAVNQGPEWSVIRLQLCLGLSSGEQDGVVGPVTVEAAQRALPWEVLPLFLARRALRYLENPPGVRLGLLARLFRLMLFIVRLAQ